MGLGLAILGIEGTRPAEVLTEALHIQYIL